MKVKNQKEFDAALAKGEIPEIENAATYDATLAKTVIVWGSSQATIKTWESSQATIETRGSSQATIETWGSSQATIKTWQSSQATIEASGYAQLSVVGKAVVRASATNAILTDGVAAIEGGIVIVRPALTSAEQWCEEYGVEVKNGLAVLFKGVNDDFFSPHGCDYKPGSVPSAEDWDGGEYECGGGLHFSPTANATTSFHPTATKFVACPVALADMRPPKSSDEYPSKIKASKCCAPVWEVNRRGERIEEYERCAKREAGA